MIPIYIKYILILSNILFFYSISLHAPSRTQMLNFYFEFQVDFASSGYGEQILKTLNFHLSDADISSKSTFEEVQQWHNVYAS